MKRVLPFLLLASGSVWATPFDAWAVERPNFVIILADDLGFGDVSCYGSELIHTPQLDRMARDGMRFTDAHSPASICSPSRYGVLTGSYPWRLHQTGNGYRLPQRPNLAAFLQAQGYRTGAVGKWHLGYSKDWNRPPITGPLEAGFTYHFGVPTNHNDEYRVFIEDHDLVGRMPGREFRVVQNQVPEGVSQPRVEDLVDTTLTRKAIDFLRRSQDVPFFLYFTPCAPHTHVTPAEQYRGTSRAGLYGDHIQELDAHVGELLSALDELDLAAQTLVFFASDNGAAPRDFQGSAGFELNLASEAGEIRAKYRTAKRDARALGHLANGPWHDGKGSPYEGGHRTPFIARWPGHVPAGTVSDETICLTDLFATIAAVVGAPLPDDAALDSFDVSPVLFGRAPASPVRDLTVLQGDTRDDALAVRSGPWKLIESQGGKKHELYDLRSDPGETHDIARERVDIVRQLAGRLEKLRLDGRQRPAQSH